MRIQAHAQLITAKITIRMINTACSVGATLHASSTEHRIRQANESSQVPPSIIDAPL